MVALTITLDDQGRPVADVQCNGCSAPLRIPVAVPATVAFVARALGSASISFQVDGLYFGECCRGRVAKAVHSNSQMHIAKERRRR